MSFSLRSPFSAYFHRSWLPPAVFVAALLLWSFAVHVGLSLFPEPWNTPSATKFISLPFGVVLLLSMVGLFMAPFVAAFRRRLGTMALLFASWIAAIFVLGLVEWVTIRAVDKRWDRFADGLTIPADLAAADPLPRNAAPDVGFDSLPDGSGNCAAFCLSGIDGVYSATLFLRTNEPGQLSLRAFEATTGFPLSKSTLAKRTTRELGGGMQRFDGMEFVIGEGDERHPYAARFELWFRPASGKPEVKLAERIYRIVGVSF